MTSQVKVRDLFNLPSSEEIFDDFGCALNDGIILNGRMYLTENFVCFYSSILGQNKKLIILIKDVTKIVKKKTLGMFKYISIYIPDPSAVAIKKHKEKSYKFSSFSDCDSTYKILSKLWHNIW